MATAVPTISAAPANAHAWLHRALAYFLPPQVPVPATGPLEAAITDLRLILRRIEHARREHARWDTRFLAQTVARAVLIPLEDLALPVELDSLRHGAIFALRPIAAIGTGKSRAEVDVSGELTEAADLMRAAIVNAERGRMRA